MSEDFPDRPFRKDNKARGVIPITLIFVVWRAVKSRLTLYDLDRNLMNCEITTFILRDIIVAIDQQAIGPVLGRIPSGIFILTVKNDAGQETGMLASWVQQASFDPPAVTVAVNSKRYLNDWLSDGCEVVLNLIGETQKQFLGHFGKGFEPDEPAFEGLNVDRTPAGSPILPDTLGWMSGNVRGSIDGGDHQIYVVEITSAQASTAIDNEKPYVHLRKNGFNY